MIKKETTFENAKEGDRVYSPLFKCKNLGDKTNATVSNIRSDKEFCIDIIPDLPTTLWIGFSFKIDGSFWDGGGQGLFWENPIKEIPTRPKRKVTKRGWIGIMPLSSEYLKNGIMARASDVFLTKEGFSGQYSNKYQAIEVEFDAEE